MRKVKVAIIGAGTAGLSARREVAQVTDDYVVIDDGPLGTTCARVGCMPSKVLIQVAKDFHRRHQFELEGIHGGDSLRLSQRQVLAHVRRLRDRFVQSVVASFEPWRDKLICQRARFLSSHVLQVGDEQIEFVTGKMSFEGYGRAIIKLEELGRIHLYAGRDDGQILGAELFCPDAEHLAQQLAWVISLKLTVAQVLALPFYHPVIEEGLRSALRDAAAQVQVHRPALEVLRCEESIVLRG